MSALQLLCRLITPSTSSPAYQAAQQSHNAVFEQIPKELADALTLAYVDLADIEVEESFIRGFRLGFTLAGELAQPPGDVNSASFPVGP